jgi:hypothetical protein
MSQSHNHLSLWGMAVLKLLVSKITFNCGGPAGILNIRVQVTVFSSNIKRYEIKFSLETKKEYV